MRMLLVPTVLIASLVAASSLPLAPAQDKDKPGDVHFEVYKDKGDEFRFRLKEGDTILAIAGKGYKTKAEVDKVVDAIKKDASKAKVVDNTKAK